MNIQDFTEFMTTHGHILIKYYTHIVCNYNQDIADEVLHQSEYEGFTTADWYNLSKKVSISLYRIDSSDFFADSDIIFCGHEADSMYSTCWFGEEFFVWLFKDQYERSFNDCDSLELPITLSENSNIHGSYEYGESHSFFIMTTEDEAIIFNNYGGSCNFKVNTLSIERAEELLNNIYNPEYDLHDTTGELFGYGFDTLGLNGNRENVKIILDIHELHIPTNQEMITKVRWIIDNTVHDVDKKFLECHFYHEFEHIELSEADYDLYENEIEILQYGE